MSVFTVVLPRHQKAVFPDRCIVCNFFPPAFNVDVRSTYVEYEFRDGSPARESAELNHACSESDPLA